MYLNLEVSHAGPHDQFSASVTLIVYQIILQCPAKEPELCVYLRACHSCVAQLQGSQVSDINQQCMDEEFLEIATTEEKLMNIQTKIDEGLTQVFQGKIENLRMSGSKQNPEYVFRSYKIRASILGSLIEVKSKKSQAEVPNIDLINKPICCERDVLQTFEAKLSQRKLFYSFLETIRVIIRPNSRYCCPYF